MDWQVLVPAIVAILCVFAGSFYTLEWDKEYRTACEDKNGIVVTTYSNYLCINKNVEIKL